MTRSIGKFAALLALVAIVCGFSATASAQVFTGRIDVTIEDPASFVTPVERHVTWLSTPGEELFETICPENNKFLQNSAFK